MSVTADPATNRLVVSGMAYDANGNVTNMPGVGTLAYDARNRITGAGGVPTRGYDPGNRKIWWKDSNGITFVDYWLPNGEKLVTYKIDEAPYVNDQRYPGPVQFLTVTRTLYFAGRQVKVEGRYGVGGYVEWPQPDRLSSNTRHHPYGEERGTSSTEYKFATYQREASGLDYALNRYYSSVYGRFLSSDPYRASGGPSDPGSWNRYAYTRGDPANKNDPSGLMDCVTEGNRIRCFDSVTVLAQFEYITVDGVAGWHSVPVNRSFQDLYEQPGCTDPSTGLPCYEVDRLRKECSDLAPPPIPMGVDIAANVKTVLSMLREALGPDRDEGRYGEFISWFVGMVDTGGEWDFKKGGHREYENFGNWHFGAVAAAAFTSVEFAKFGAGIVQAFTDIRRVLNGRSRIGEGIPGLPPTYGDPLSDQHYIGRGFQFQARDCARFQ